LDRVDDLGDLVNARSAVPQIAVIGAGYAGIASAVSLVERGIGCTVFESARVLGGRARKIEYQDNTLDNGQHILSGAYRELLRMMALVGVDSHAYQRVPLALEIAPDFSLRAPRLPAPLHLAFALFCATGISFSERIDAIRFMQSLKKLRFQVDPNQTVAELLYAHQQSHNLTRHLWQPLTVSALNTPIETASAQVFANVLRDTLAGRRELSDLVFPKTDLSALFPERAAAWLGDRGCRVQTGARVTAVTREGARFRVTSGEEKLYFGGIIVAVGPHQLDKIDLPCAISPPFQYEPIYTIYLKYPKHVPFAQPMIGRVGGMAHWFFDREALSGHAGLVAAVISASGAHEALDSLALARHVHDELVATVGPLPLPQWHKVVAEKFATFACTPVAQNTARPTTTTPVAGLYLAGDYVHCDYPATLEAAVRNGVAAAAAAEKFLVKAPDV
jgi:squalene-associated FAD-dependent desaturase